MKHINDILNESILDNDLGDKVDEQIIRNWFEKMDGPDTAKSLEFTDDLRVCLPQGSWIRLSIDNPIPSYIKIADAWEITLHLNQNGNIEIPDGFLPEMCHELEIYIRHPHAKKLEFKSKQIEVDRFAISSNQLQTIILPKTSYIEFMDLSGCETLGDIKNIQKVEKANFPSSLGANLIRKHLKFQGEVKINGFGPY